MGEDVPVSTQFVELRKLVLPAPESNEKIHEKLSAMDETAKSNHNTIDKHTEDIRELGRRLD